MQAYLLKRISNATPGIYRKALLSAAVSFLVINAWAQKDSLEAGVHMGIAMTRLYDRSGNDNDFYFRQAPDMGIRVGYGLSQMLSLSGEINYVRIGSRRDGLLPLGHIFPQNGFPEGSFANFTEQVHLDYLEIPLMINGQTGERLKLSVGLGPFIGIRLGAGRTTTGSSHIYRDSAGHLTELLPLQPPRSLESSQNITKDTRAINLGGCQRVGLSYKTGRGRIGLEARYSFGLTDIWKKGRSADVNKTDQLALRLAYTIQL